MNLLDITWPVAAVLGYWLGVTLQRAKRARQVRAIREAGAETARYLEETASEHYLRGSGRRALR
jgi:hypothetical protein